MTVGGQTLTVATYNIRAAIGPGEPFPPAWWRHASRARLARLAEVIHGLDADVVSLQEVGLFNVDGDLVDQPSELAASTGMAVRYAAAGHFAIVEPEDGRVAGTALWGNAVLSRLPIESTWATGLPRAADDDLVEPPGARHPLSGAAHPLAGVRYDEAPVGSREPRCALRVTVAGPTGPVTVISTHFTHVGSGQRHAQAALVAELAGGTKGPLVVLGDLNAGIEREELAPLRTLEDAFEIAGHPPGAPERRSCGPWAIDHVLVRGLRPAACRVAVEAGDASDHWPVVATLAS